jgi:hypothetical protein
MTFKRLLMIGLVGALALRLLPVLGPIVWPGFRRSVARLQRRADLATAAVMLALIASMFLQHQPLFGALVAVLSLPALVAAARALRP